jgi:hypothetical protein
MKASSFVFAAILLAFGTSYCHAQEPTDSEAIAELRQEVSELRKLVAELTAKTEAMEYQWLPRAADAKANPQARPRLAPDVPPYLRFPIDIERGTWTISTPLMARRLNDDAPVRAP